MKSLKYSDLKGSRTAIHCITQLEWDKVTEICGYEWTGGRWDMFEEDSVIYLDAKLHSSVWVVDETDYTIITASDFIAANSEGEDVDTLEGNKLIAIFMGWTFQPAFSDANESRRDRWDTPHSPAWMNTEQMVFDSSWNWLMPVVRFAKTKGDSANYVAWNTLNYYLQRVEIDGVYQAVVQFIQWYNSTLSPSTESK